MARKSRAEFRENMIERQEQTDRQLEAHEAFGAEAEVTIEQVNKLMEWDPIIQETADAVNDARDGFDEHIVIKSKETGSKVEEPRDLEKSEVSDPAREGAQNESQAARAAEAAAEGSQRFGRHISDMASPRHDAAKVLDEIAEKSEEHQAEVTARKEQSDRRTEDALSKRRQF